MTKHTAELKYTCGMLSQLPRDGIPQIALSGRSNVGKSSLINALFSRNKLARVSGVPGKTVTINIYFADNRFYFADLPGYGFAKRPPEEKAAWSRLVDGYFKLASKNNSALCGVIQLVDMKVGPTADDMQMVEYLEHVGIPYFVVATKSDKLNATDRKKALEDLNDTFRSVPVIPFSSLRSEGITETWSAAEKLLQGE